MLIISDIFYVEKLTFHSEFLRLKKLILNVEFYWIIVIEVSIITPFLWRITGWISLTLNVLCPMNKLSLDKMCYLVYSWIWFVTVYYVECLHLHSQVIANLPMIHILCVLISRVILLLAIVCGQSSFLTHLQTHQISSYIPCSLHWDGFI